ncbi:hypothetical protein MJA45_20575 [Paenibacillus aurantius]|uniref:Uncharacterized protein n=1 Tax=Paenibacillus aurantius TaxID=2918900 RepID=A0AA96LB87_9BACL|nr:hypothetical protein [Paenibacillus aurantius]WJH34785.1 hypothetical protein N6H14_00825 [Paenibacillus sp. CC-CFT747]WNQ09998.1 hypothetical protein MJA45_20575 [Paenibacillus aurantius]
MKVTGLTLAVVLAGFLMAMSGRMPIGDKSLSESVQTGGTNPNPHNIDVERFERIQAQTGHYSRFK